LLWIILLYPPMRKLDPVKHEEKRREILKAVARCFRRSGLNGASISDICAEAKISPGHLYHYFEDKDAIIAAMAEERLSEISKHFERAVARPGSLLADMLSEIDSLTQSEGAANSALLFEMLAEAVRNRPVAKTLRAFSRQMRRVLADVLHHGRARGEIDKEIDPDVAATVVVGVMDALRALPLRYPENDTAKATHVLKLLTSRLLSPGVAKAGQSGKRKLKRSTARD
jgi:TetR/AcrR family transcriptional regulator, repressor for uid operon